MLAGKEAMKCPECGNEKLIRDFEAGELVCEQCGFVIFSTILNYAPSGGPST